MKTGYRRLTAHLEESEADTSTHTDHGQQSQPQPCGSESGSPCPPVPPLRAADVCPPSFPSPGVGTTRKAPAARPLLREPHGLCGRPGLGVGVRARSGLCFPGVAAGRRGALCTQTQPGVQTGAPGGAGLRGATGGPSAAGARAPRQPRPRTPARSGLPSLGPPRPPPAPGLPSAPLGGRPARAPAGASADGEDEAGGGRGREQVPRERHLRAQRPRCHRQPSRPGQATRTDSLGVPRAQCFPPGLYLRPDVRPPGALRSLPPAPTAALQVGFPPASQALGPPRPSSRGSGTRTTHLWPTPHKARKVQATGTYRRRSASAGGLLTAAGTRSERHREDFGPT